MNNYAAQQKPIQDFYVHLISDATGTTLQGLARACLAQFENIHPQERFWPLVRTRRQLERVMEDVQEHPGPVIFTLVDRQLRKRLETLCAELGVPCMPVLDPIIRGLSSYIGMPSKNIPGLQHELDREYFHRIDAIDFALSFDDGQNLEGIEESDVILVGVSRTSKTPTCVYLARRGIRAANIPLVPGRGLPEHVLNLQGPLFVGLTESPDRLIELRNSRLRADSKDQRMLFNNDYLDPEKVGEEVRQARRFFAQQKWPVIDVTRKSVEETSAEIMFLLQRRKTAKEDDQ
jgi:hypothetical protein